MSYSLTRASVWNITGYLYLLIASFVSTPILIHSLTLPVFARYSLILATLALASSLDLGLPQAVVRQLVKNKNATAKRQEIWASSSLLFILSGIIIGLFAAAVVAKLTSQLTLSLLVFGLVVMQNLTSHYTTLPQSEGHFGYFNTKTFIVGTANTLIAAYLASRGFDIDIILATQLFCYLLTLIPLVYFSLKFFPRPWEYLATKKVSQSLISFGIRNQAGKLIGQIQSQYSKYLLATTSAILLSGYVIAQGLVQKMVGGISQLATALYPRSSQTQDLAKLKSLYLRLQLTLFSLSLLGVVIYFSFGNQFFSWWLANPQLVAIVTRVFDVLIWYFVLLVPTPLASTILDGQGRPELTSIAAFATAVIEISVALILYQSIGLMAPVYSATLAVLITTPLLLYQSIRVLQSKS